MKMEAQARRTIEVTLTMDEEDLNILNMMRAVHVPDDVLSRNHITRTQLETWRDHVGRVCALAGDD